MVDTLLTFLTRISHEPIAVVIELVLIGLCVNWCASVLQGTRGTRPLRGVLVILVIATIIVYVLVNQFGWVRLELLYKYVLSGLGLIALVVFQPELRRAIIRVGDVRFPRSRGAESQLVSALVKTAAYLSKNKYGGLIAIQRDIDLTGWAENGTVMRAEVTANLLNTIFYPGSALHDLGVIIRGNRVVAANCQFPSAASDEIDMALGSRHLAALGMSYETDAVVLVVSEETGVISIADNGKLTRYLSLDDLSGELTSRLERRRTMFGGDGGFSGIWTIVQRALIVLPITFATWYLTDQATLADATVNIEVAVQVSDATQIVDVLEPRSARAEGAHRRPDALNVDVLRLRATLVGSAKQIDRLRRDTADRPLPVHWTLAGTDALPGEHPLRAEELRPRLDALPELATRGLAVRAQALPDIRYRVDERLAVELKVQPDAGAARIAVDAVDPPTTTVVFRRKDFETFLGKPAMRADIEQFAADRTVRAPLGDAITDWEPETPRTIEVALDDTVGTLRAAAIEPAKALVTARVVGQRRKVENVVVNLFVAPGVEGKCDITKDDANEWRIDVEVTGREALLRDLSPKDIQAFVRVTPDMLPPAGASPSDLLRVVDVTILTPEGVTLAAGPRKTVRITLTPRAGAPS